MSEIHIEAEFPLEAAYPLEIIWRDLFRSIFSNIGHIAALGNCRNPKTGEYRSSALELHLASAKADRSMRLAHELL